MVLPNIHRNWYNAGFAKAALDNGAVEVVDGCLRHSITNYNEAAQRFWADVEALEKDLHRGLVFTAGELIQNMLNGVEIEVDQNDEWFRHGYTVGFYRTFRR